MSTAQTSPPDTSVLRIEGDMTIYRAAELKQTLLAALDGGLPLVLDLSAVSELDTSGVQLLMLAKHHAQQSRQGLILLGHSPAVLEVFELFNLGAYFGDPLVFGAGAATGRA